MEKILAYYDGYDEESRLVRDNSYRTEFVTTVHVLDSYIPAHAHILEVGAGTGRYSFYYAERGHQVLALDITPKHVEIIASKISGSRLANIRCALADARDLSAYDDNSFDVVLCLGPFYHLRKREDRVNCIKECKRVLKPGGLLAVAYLNKYAAYVRNFMKNRRFILDRPVAEFIDNDKEFGDDRDCFYFTGPEEMERFMQLFDMEKLENVGVSGIASILFDAVKQLDDEEYKAWLDYHFHTMREPSLIGYSLHCLYVCRKSF